MILTKQKGYILLEGLICLLILNTIVLSMIQTLPLIIETKHRIDIERTLFNTLYELYDQQTFYQKSYPSHLVFTEPIPFTVIITNENLCATYIWRDNHEKEICLF